MKLYSEICICYLQYKNYNSISVDSDFFKFSSVSSVNRSDTGFDSVISDLCIIVLTLLPLTPVLVEARDKLGLVTLVIVSGFPKIDVIGVTGSKRLEDKDWSTARLSSSELTGKDFFADFSVMNEFSVLVPKLVVAIEAEISEPEVISGSDFMTGVSGTFRTFSDFSGVFENPA